MTFGISWIAAIPLIASSQGLLDKPVSPYLHYLVLSGPVLSAIIMTGINTGISGIIELLGRLLRWRVGIMWFFIASLSPVALFLLVAGVISIFTGS